MRTKNISIEGLRGKPHDVIENRLSILLFPSDLTSLSTTGVMAAIDGGAPVHFEMRHDMSGIKRKYVSVMAGGWKFEFEYRRRVR